MSHPNRYNFIVYTFLKQRLKVIEMFWDAEVEKEMNQRKYKLYTLIKSQRKRGTKGRTKTPNQIHIYKRFPLK